MIYWGLFFILLNFLIFIIQVQYYFHGKNNKNHIHQDLHNQNVLLMNRFLSFKNIELKNLQAELSIKDTLYKKLFDFAPNAFVIITSGTITYFNDAYLKLLNASKGADLLNKNIYDFIHPSSLDAVQSSYKGLLSGAEDHIDTQAKILALDNEIKHIKLSSALVYFEDTSYIFCSCYDLSKEYEQAQTQATLERNIAQERFKVEFFANVSHDLKTPINVIYSATQLQDMYIDANEYGEILSYNNIIKQNCLRLQKLLNDILDITKIDADFFKPNLEPCNIISTIEHMAQSIASYIKTKNISIIFDTNVETKLVMVDTHLIERIMLNLLSNAIKYGKENGNVWVTLYDEGHHLIISIKDNGIGIAKEQLSNIFKRFYKTHNHTDGTFNSSGIGLSLVESIIRRLDGTIFCMSKEGIGSEFIVILPMITYNDDSDDFYNGIIATDLTSNLNIELSDI